MRRVRGTSCSETLRKCNKNKILGPCALSDYGRPGGSARDTLNALPPKRCRGQCASVACVRVHMSAGAPVPAPRGPPCTTRRPAVSGAGVCVGGRACVRERLATSTRPWSRPPAGSARVLTTPPVGQSAAAKASGRRPPVACRYSHTGRRCRATRTADARATVHRLPEMTRLAEATKTTNSYY